MKICSSLAVYASQICFALLLTGATAIYGQEKKEPTLDEIKKMRVVYTVAGMERARVRKNITYKKAGELSLQMDLYSPPDLGKDERRPAIIFVPGDAPWEILKDIKDWGVYLSYGQLAAAHGFVGVTFNHRSSDKRTKVRDAAADVDDLVNYVREHAGDFNIERDKICVWVFSAGGVYLRSVLKDKPGYVRCIVTYYSLLGFSKGEAPDDIAVEFTVANYLKQNPKALAPMLVVKGGKDFPDINGAADEFVREAMAQNINLEFINYPEGQHAFDVEDDTEQTRRIIRRTLEFIKEHLR
ncbi:MAG TPA: alpha/beta hydrolase [Pyrinomonadaceae bacterium]